MQNKFLNYKLGFSLAEVLLALLVIGVIAAVTLPNLIKNYQKHMTVVKLKRAYNIANQVMLQSYNDNGTVTREIYHSGDNYIENYWLKYIKNAVLYDEPPYKKEAGQTFPHWYRLSGYAFNVYAYSEYRPLGFYMFKLADGTIFYLTSRSKLEPYEVFIDINGVEKPNIVGKDIFMFYQNFEKNRLMEISPTQTNFNNDYIIVQCKEYAWACAQKIIKDGWKIKDDYPW